MAVSKALTLRLRLRRLSTTTDVCEEFHVYKASLRSAWTLAYLIMIMGIIASRSADMFTLLPLASLRLSREDREVIRSLVAVAVDCHSVERFVAYNHVDRPHSPSCLVAVDCHSVERFVAYNHVDRPQSKLCRGYLEKIAKIIRSLVACSGGLSHNVPETAAATSTFPVRRAPRETRKISRVVEDNVTASRVSSSRCKRLWTDCDRGENTQDIVQTAKDAGRGPVLLLGIATS
ncbi:hypothetical protein J6590_066832 [Homalodisca vitripennis]|nr:hypothetical protein J6590_066832 [Homalodisca vitripennis]